MKINFDTITYDPFKSYHTTLTSSVIFPSNNQFSLIDLTHDNNMTQSLISSTSLDQHNPNRTFTKVNPKSNLILQATSSHLFIDKGSNQKIPKKFKNLKTINDMEQFIKSMGRIPSTKAMNSHQKNKKNQFNNQKSRQKVLQVSSRLYQSNTRFCKKKSCQQIVPTKERYEIEDMMNFTGQPNKDRINKNLTKSKNFQVSEKLYRSLDVSHDQFSEDSTQKVFQKNNDVHDRLFKDFNTRKQLQEKTEKQFEMKCINLSRSLQKKSREESNKKKNGSTLRGFYQRLNELSQRQKNKDRLCQIVESVTPYLNSKNFKTKKNQNEEKKRKVQIQKQIFQKVSILSKTLIKCSKVKCHDEQQLRKSKQKLKTQQIPFISEKTKELIQDHKRRLLAKIKGLFYDKKKKQIKINSAKIYMLSERQFSILFELITKVEKQTSKIKTEKKLQQIIQSFYQKLGFAQKQELRRYQRMALDKIKNQKQEPQTQKAGMSGIKQKQVRKRKKSSGEQNDRNLTDSSSIDHGTDYCARLAMFV